MICVIAAIEVAPGRREELLALVRAILPKVRAETGCIEYGPMIDVASGLAAQSPLRDNVVTMIEKWESIAALEAHLATPHMAEFFHQAAAIQRSLNLQVLQPA
jgi:quinol monooxygenase YgiN